MPSAAPADASVAERVARLPRRARAAALARFSAGELASWAFWARPDQLDPAARGLTTGADGAPWFAWLILAGRGWGKTRTGAEFVLGRVRSGRYGRIALVAETAADARDVMVEGESGLLRSAPAAWRPVYEPSKRRLTFPNGAVATTFAGEKPDQLRGPQFDLAWVDELAKYRYAQATWDMLAFGLRLERDPTAPPQVCVTTTPRPIGLLRALVADPSVVVTRGASYDNVANLSGAFVRRVIGKYEGTTLGRQELRAELLDEAPGALWTRASIEAARVTAPPGPLYRVGVAVDPTSGAGAGDECGLVVGGSGDAPPGADPRVADARHGYVLADETLRGSPDAWGRAVVRAYHAFDADAVIAEGNQGGEMVRSVLTLAALAEGVACPPVRIVYARRGKRARAEPTAAAYEQGRWHHVGAFPGLEDQLVTWTPEDGESPGRLDALVWLDRYLMRRAGGAVGAEVL